jgi:hypothetical protein
LSSNFLKNNTSQRTIATDEETSPSTDALHRRLLGCLAHKMFLKRGSIGDKPIPPTNTKENSDATS